MDMGSTAMNKIRLNKPDTTLQFHRFSENMFQLYTTICDLESEVLSLPKQILPDTEVVFSLPSDFILNSDEDDEDARAREEARRARNTNVFNYFISRWIIENGKIEQETVDKCVSGLESLWLFYHQLKKMRQRSGCLQSCDLFGQDVEDWTSDDDHYGLYQ
jgi:hypothetical protein